MLFKSSILIAICAVWHALFIFGYKLQQISLWQRSRIDNFYSYIRALAISRYRLPGTVYPCIMNKYSYYVVSYMHPYYRNNNICGINGFKESIISPNGNLFWVYEALLWGPGAHCPHWNFVDAFWRICHTLTSHKWFLNMKSNANK